MIIHTICLDHMMSRDIDHVMSRDIDHIRFIYITLHVLLYNDPAN